VAPLLRLYYAAASKDRNKIADEVSRMCAAGSAMLPESAEALVVNRAIGDNELSIARLESLLFPASCRMKTPSTSARKDQTNSSNASTNAATTHNPLQAAVDLTVKLYSCVLVRDDALATMASEEYNVLK
jgi:hypothetical protein